MGGLNLRPQFEPCRGYETAMRGQLTLNIARDFSPVPGGRFARHGRFSGEEFRRDFLLPRMKEAIASGSVLEVELDGATGYAASFLEEAFGGLVRDGLSKADVLRHLKIATVKPRYEPFKLLAIDYINHA